MKRTLVLSVFTVIGMCLSSAVETGTAAPEFTLTDSNGKSHTLSAYKGKHVVLEWLNHGCPFVRKHYGSGNMQALQKEYTGKDVIWFSVCSGSTGQSAEKANQQSEKNNAVPTAVLLDPDGTVGKAYGAKTTPHMFVVDPKGNLIYQGAIDSIRSAKADDIPKATNYVKQALDESMAGKPVSQGTTKPYGCGVKYGGKKKKKG